MGFTSPATLCEDTWDVRYVSIYHVQRNETNGQMECVAPNPELLPSFNIDVKYTTFKSIVITLWSVGSVFCCPLFALLVYANLDCLRKKNNKKQSDVSLLV